VPELSIVVPAYNEAARLTEGVGRLSEAIHEGSVDPQRTEILVVDDGSTDDTAATAKELLEQFPHHRLVRQPENRGKGAAVRAGVAEATGSVIAYMDADMAIHPRQLPELLAALDDADVAIGSRAMGGHRVAYATRLRTLQGRAFNRAVNALTGIGLDDTQCGFKAFRAPVARLLLGTTVIDRFAFDMELLAAARHYGMRIAEVSVRWSDVPGSRVHPVWDPVSMIVDLLGSRTPLHRPPPVLALEVSGADADAVFAALGDSTLPVLPWVGHGSAVLFPLRAHDVTEVAGRLAESLPTTSARRLTVTVHQLRGRSPLHLARAQLHEVGTIGPCRANGTSPPGTGRPR
jgi:hypothetical protein